MLDRLTRDCEILWTGNDYWRMKHHSFLTNGSGQVAAKTHYCVGQNRMPRAGQSSVRIGKASAHWKALYLSVAKKEAARKRRGNWPPQT